MSILKQSGGWDTGLKGDMKKKHLIRQFQKHMIITVAIIALAAVMTVLGIRYWQRSILPSDTELFIDVTSTFADGNSYKKTYSLELESADGKTRFNEENDIKNNDSKEKENEEESILISVGKAKGDNEGEEESQSEILIIDSSKVQTGTSLAVSKIQNGFSKLKEEEQQLYSMLGYCKYILPVIYSLFGVVLSCFIFYRRQIKKPIAVLAEATDKIYNNNLDFEISSDCRNELGCLCDSFEKMRQALVNNNKDMLQMIEERRMLQASVAHDLRNPIAIMKGYLEMMEYEMEEESAGENFEEEVKTLMLTADRMEQYIESVSIINRLGDMELEPVWENIDACIDNWEKDMTILAEDSGIEVIFEHESIGEKEWRIDSKAISRVLENIINNGCRYADTMINVSISATDNKELVFEIADDGPGYQDKLLKNPDLYFYTTEPKNGHMGMGMTICRILCKKHQGSISLSNGDQGGAITVFTVKNFI